MTYESLYAPGVLVRPEQWLAEYMCGRQARAKGVDLPRRFWSNPSYKTVWEKELRRQVRAAATLLKLYRPQAVSAALRTKEGRKVLSLSAPWLDDLVKAEEQRLAREAELRAAAAEARPPEPPPPAEKLPPGYTRPPFVHKKSILSKLEGL
jgi:hypothetical protein